MNDTREAMKVIAAKPITTRLHPVDPRPDTSDAAGLTSKRIHIHRQVVSLATGLDGRQRLRSQESPPAATSPRRPRRPSS